LADRLAEVEALIAESEEAGRRWAESAAIKVPPIPPDVIDRAARYFGSPQGWDGVTAYCRHRLTNYDALLREADEYAGRPQDIIMERVREAVEEALKRIGVGEWTFYEQDD
jgi:hypothetical protein